MKTFGELTDAELDALHRARTSTAVARPGRVARRRRRRARQPPDHGPGDPRPRRAALRARDPRLRPLLHRAPRPRPVRPLRRRRPARAPPGSWSAPATSPSACARRSTTRTPTPRSGSARRASTRDLFAPIAGRAERRRSRSRRWPPGPARARPGGLRASSLGSRPRRRRRRGRLVRRGRRGPRVIFVGKLIVSKGVDLLLAAWPLVHARHPGARLLIVGFGALDAVASGRRGRPRPRRPRAAARARRARARARGGRGRAARRCSPRSSSALPAGYADAARAAAGSVAFAGRLEHDEVAVPVAAVRRARLPEHLPGGVRDGRRGGGRRPARCPSRPPTRARAEVSHALAADLPDAAKRPGLVRASRRRGRGDRRAAQRWLALDRPTGAPRPAHRCARRSSGCGAGSRSRAACSRRRRASSTSCRCREPTETLKLARALRRRRRRDQ